jgi:hypothetical protein
MEGESRLHAEWLNDDESDEPVDSRRTGLARHSAIVRAAYWFIAGALVATGAVTVLRQKNDAIPAPLAAPPTSVLKAEPDSAMQTVLAIAHKRTATGDYVRQTSPPGACKVVPLGHSPSDAIVRALLRNLPSTTQPTFARTLDEFTALCSVQVRADYRDAVLALSISAPASAKGQWRFARVQTSIVTTPDGATTEYALCLSRDGWQVLAGATGRASSLPGTQELLALAQDPHVTW